MRIAPFIFDRETIIKLLLLILILFCFTSGAAYFIADQFLCQETLTWVWTVVLISATIIGPSFMSNEDSRHEEYSVNDRFN